MSDLAIVGQDPGFAGGLTAQTEALWQAAKWWQALPKRPSKDDLHVKRRRLTGAFCVDQVLGVLQNQA